MNRILTGILVVTIMFSTLGGAFCFAGNDPVDINKNNDTRLQQTNSLQTNLDSLFGEKNGCAIFIDESSNHIKEHIIIHNSKCEWVPLL